MTDNFNREENSMFEQQRNLRVRYEFGSAKFEAEGNAEDVARHSAAFLSEIHLKKKMPQSISATSEVIQLPLFDKSEVIVLEDTTTSQLPNASVVPKSDPDLITFFMDKAVNPETMKVEPTQHNQLLIIAHFLQQYQGKETVSLADFQTAYKSLQQIPVQKPANLPARLSECVSRGFLFKKGDGFALTMGGKRRIAA